MRFNDKELASLSLADADLEGRLNYRKIPSGNFSQSGSGFKERWFKLKYNLLFYFKINDLGQIEEKPAGVFVLESAKIQMELTGGQFAFSIIFCDDPEKRHIFSARSENTVHSWVNSLKKATYEYLRNQLITLQGKISRKTGKDPLLMIPRNKGTVRNFDESTHHHSSFSFVKTSFQSHVKLESSQIINPSQSHVKLESPQIINPSQRVPEANLIEL